MPRRKPAAGPARPVPVLPLGALQRTMLDEIRTAKPDRCPTPPAALDFALRLASAVVAAGRTDDFLPTPPPLAELLREMGVEPHPAPA